MHCIRGIGIGKKVFRLFGKNFKTKNMPLPFVETEKKTMIQLIEANLSSYIQAEGSFNLDILPNMKKSIKNFDTNFQKIYKKAIQMSSNCFYYMYFLRSQMKAEKNINSEKFEKKISLGCQLITLEKGEGMKIVLVKDESLALKIDLRVNDIIAEMNQIQICDISDFKFALEKALKKKEIFIKVIRKDELNREFILNIKYRL